MDRSLPTLRAGMIAVVPGAARLRVRLGGVWQAVPAAVAVHTHAEGRRAVEWGEPAWALQGRCPERVAVVRPFRAGRVADVEAAAFLLQATLRARSAVHRVGRGTLIALPSDLPEVELRRWEDLAAAIGLRNLRFVPSALAAARGGGLPVQEAQGQLVVDIGASATQVAAIADGAVVTSATVEVGTDTLDAALIRACRRDHALLIGPHTAERIRQTVAAATPTAPPAASHAAGRCLRRGTPREIRLERTALVTALTEPIAALGAGIRRVLVDAPQALAADVISQGVLLTGGGAWLPGLDDALRAECGLPFFTAEAPDLAVCRGLAPDPRTPVEIA